MKSTPGFRLSRSHFSSTFVVVENTTLQQYRHGSGAMRARHTGIPLNIDENKTTTGTHMIVFEGSERKIANHLQFGFHVVDWTSNIPHF